MTKNPSHSKQQSYYWWAANDKTSAVCDRCSAAIPRGQGYVVEPSILGVGFGGVMQDISYIPDMICETCYNASETIEPFQGHIPGLCDRCGRAYKPGVVIRLMGGKSKYTYSASQTVRETPVRNQDVHICERCVQSKKYRVDTHPDIFTAYAEVFFGVLFSLAILGLVIFGEPPGKFEITMVLCPAATLILLGHGIWSIFSQISKRRLASSYFDMPTSVLLKESDAFSFFKDDIGWILRNRGADTYWTAEEYAKTPRPAGESFTLAATSDNSIRKTVDAVRYWLKVGEYDKARAEYEKSLGCVLNWEANDLYGQVLAGLGEKEMAADAFRLALLQEPGQPVVMEHLKALEN